MGAAAPAVPDAGGVENAPVTVRWEPSPLTAPEAAAPATTSYAYVVPGARPERTAREMAPRGSPDQGAPFLLAGRWQ